METLNASGNAHGALLRCTQAKCPKIGLIPGRTNQRTSGVDPERQDVSINIIDTHNCRYVHREHRDDICYGYVSGKHVSMKAYNSHIASPGCWWRYKSCCPCAWLPEYKIYSNCLTAYGQIVLTATNVRRFSALLQLRFSTHAAGKVRRVCNLVSNPVRD